jgi:hypothetical protein
VFQSLQDSEWEAVTFLPSLTVRKMPCWSVVLSFLAASCLVAAAPTPDSSILSENPASPGPLVSSKGYIVKLKSSDEAFTTDIDSVRTLLGESQAFKYNYAWINAFAAEMSGDVLAKLHDQMGDSIDVRTKSFRR